MKALAKAVIATSVQQPPPIPGTHQPKPGKSVHEVCALIKHYAIEIVTTVVFLAVLLRGAWIELGLPPIPWDH